MPLPGLPPKRFDMVRPNNMGASLVKRRTPPTCLHQESVIAFCKSGGEGSIQKGLSMARHVLALSLSLLVFSAVPVAYADQPLGSGPPADITDLTVPIQNWSHVIEGRWSADYEVEVQYLVIPGLPIDVYEVHGLPWGETFLTPNTTSPNDWIVVIGGVSAPLNWDAAAYRHRLKVGTNLVDATYPVIGGGLVPDPEDPLEGHPWGVVTAHQYCFADGTPSGFRFVFNDVKGVPGAQRDWIQFVSNKVTYRQGGNEGNADPGSSFPSSSSNGVPHDMTGGTEYVDAGGQDAPAGNNPPPNYEGSGIGSDDNGQTDMIDSPGLGDTDPNDVADACGLPPEGGMDEMIITSTFSTYLVVFGRVVWRFNWQHITVVPWGENGPSAPPYSNNFLTDSGASLDQMDADHLQALMNFLSGDYSGAPNQ